MSLHYLPSISLDSIKEMIFKNNVDPLYSELNSQQYERVGLDRAYMILNDMMINYGRVSGFSILDVGCNNGLLSDLFSCYGNSVTGIDNSAINQQKRYDTLCFSDNLVSDFKQIDIGDFITATNRSFDFVFLLSVSHQWEFGYAQTGNLKKDSEKIRYIISSIFQRTTRAIYYECPMDEPGFSPDYGIEFLSKYLDQYDNASIVKVSDTIASNGYMRSLYRITHAVLQDENISDEEDAYERLAALQNVYDIAGEIVVNGSFGKTKYAIHDGNSLTVRVDGNKRDYSHPWGPQEQTNSITDLWKKIKDNQPKHVVRIEKIYEEGYAQIEIVPGLPYMLTSQLPAWQRRQYHAFQQGEDKRALSVLLQMCIGLSELHELGIAHGDPYPYNAVCRDGNMKWVDLGNLSCNERDIKKDICIFFLYTFPYVLFRYGKISYRMVELLDENMQKSDLANEVMRKSVSILSNVYSDEKDISMHDIPFLFAHIYHIVNKYIVPDQNYLLAYQAYKYHTDTITWMNASDISSENYRFASLANKFSQLENTRLRISMDVHTGMIEDYKQQITALQQNIANYKQQIDILQQNEVEQNAHLQDIMEKMNQLENEINIQQKRSTCKENKLQQMIDYLEQQNNNLHGIVDFQKKHLKLLTDTIIQYEKIFQV